jgi:hypothetical protein
MSKIDLDKESAIKALKNNQFSLLKYLKPELTADKEVINAAFYKNFIDITHSGHKLKVLKNVRFIHESLLNQHDYMEQLMKKCSGYIFAYLPAKYRSNKVLFRMAITNTGFQYFKKIRNNKKFFNDDNYTAFLPFGTSHSEVLFELGLVNSVGQKIRNDKELMLLAMHYEPTSYYYLSPELKADKDIRCAMFSTWAYNGYVMIEDQSIDTIKELEFLIKGYKNGIITDEWGLEEMLRMFWDEKVNNQKKSDPKFVAFREKYGF